MIKKILGLLATAAIIYIVVMTFLNADSFHSMIQPSVQPSETVENAWGEPISEPSDEVGMPSDTLEVEQPQILVEQDSVAVEDQL